MYIDSVYRAEIDYRRDRIRAGVSDRVTSSAKRRFRAPWSKTPQDSDRSTP